MTDDAFPRTFEPDGADGSAPATAPAHRPIEISLPGQVGPYFDTGDEDPLPLGLFAAVHGRRVARAESAEWARLGGDGGYELCADSDGTVRAVLLDYDEDDRFVSSSLEIFAVALQALGEALRVIVTTDQPQAASTAYAWLSERLREADPPAFAEPENWWPMVLDDIRTTASVDNYAAFEYLDPTEGKRIVTQSGAVAVHPEERLWASLQAAGVEPEQVLRIHTDLEACFLPGHYCSMWMAQVFPDAEVTHSFPYGESADSRAEGIRRLLEVAEAEEAERAAGR